MDDLPAAHAAAIAFDLLTLLGLFLLGRRIRGPTLGIVLAYAWAAYPFTLWALSSNVNDTLVGMLLVYALLAIASPAGRGVLAALAGLTKFIPLALGPLFLRGRGPSWPRPGQVAVYVLAYGLTLAVAMLPVLLDSNLPRVLARLDRLPGRAYLAVLRMGAVGRAGLRAAPGAGRRDRARDRGCVRASGSAAWWRSRRWAAAVVIAIELAASYWLYSYIVWFFPVAAIAVFGAHPAREEATVIEPLPQPPEPIRSPSPVLAP